MSRWDGSGPARAYDRSGPLAGCGQRDPVKHLECHRHYPGHLPADALHWDKDAQVYWTTVKPWSTGPVFHGIPPCPACLEPARLVAGMGLLRHRENCPDARSEEIALNN